MAFVIRCKSHEDALRVEQVVGQHLARSRFTLTTVRCRGGMRVEWTGSRYQVAIRGVRLRQIKDYCGSHAGPCLLTGRKHRHSRYLEGLDWVSFNDMVNDALDSIDFDGDAGSPVCNIRKGRERRVEYTADQNGDWHREGDYMDYVDCCGQPPVASGYVEGTPGIFGWRLQVDLDQLDPVEQMALAEAGQKGVA